MQPALMLPMGKDDWEKGARWNFLKSCAPILERLGWTIGVELKGALYDEAPNNWLTNCMTVINQLGGRLTWHLPVKATKKLHEGIASELEKMGKLALQLQQYGLEAVTIHCAPVISIDPPEDAGLERYNSPIPAEEMLAHIKAQVEPLKQLNELVGGILNIENVDIIQFRDKGHRIPTYLALQTGCHFDLLWLKNQAGVNTTFDSEHFFSTGNLLHRQGVEHNMAHLPELDPSMYYANNKKVNFDALHELADLAWYWLVKGYPPLGLGELGWGKFIKETEPRLFHLGGGTRAMDDLGRIETHLPSFNRSKAKEALDFELCWIMEHPEVIGAVIEVTGQLDPEKYSEWSPRTYDDEVAKIQTYLVVIDEIEKLQKGI